MGAAAGERFVSDEHESGWVGRSAAGESFASDEHESGWVVVRVQLRERVLCLISMSVSERVDGCCCGSLINMRDLYLISMGVGGCSLRKTSSRRIRNG